MNRLLPLILVIALVTSCEQSRDPATATRQMAEPAVASQGELTGAELFVMACNGCHNFEAGANHRVGPNLWGIAGQPAATRDGFEYSPALQQSGVHWTSANLTAWVVATEALVPGTWMLYHNALEPDEVSRLISYIEQAGQSAQP